MAPHPATPLATRSRPGLLGQVSACALSAWRSDVPATDGGWPMLRWPPLPRATGLRPGRMFGASSRQGGKDAG